ncbi:TrmH family RNA methyltransferase [Dictyobacter aurantiacus]|uniref:rRNA methyltransferase n=1 Tax=Dictyobacter aurantiacus TaxID=1936993 RepID=A0A401ZCG2_9CHLR|nr:RNA methyltransferase [Dictyobacter aurantiacus]GCE04522.1 rRNA methyltransferase [Dictyobacter aurantiacus]
MTLITSPSNPRISKLQTLHTARGRKKSGSFLLEGPHLLETLLDAQLWPYEVYYQPALLQRTPEGAALLERLLRASSSHLIEVSERVIEALGDAQTSQGVVSVLPLDALDPVSIQRRRRSSVRPCLLILDDIADPGNMGTILRTALAANVERVLLTPHCVDYYSPKVVRSAAGAHVSLPVEVNLSWEAIADRVARHCGEPPRVLLAEAGCDQLYYMQDLVHPFALIVGNEAHGPGQQAHELSTLSISIPLANEVESLNVAMATGIILYEAVRQQAIQSGSSQ